MIIDGVPRACRAVDHFAQPRPESLVVLVHRCRGRIELAEQGCIPFDELHDHLDESIDTFFLQVTTNTVKHAGAVQRAARNVIRRQRGGHHVLAKAPILERRTGTFAINVFAVPCEFGPVVFRARDLRQHPRWRHGKNLNLAVTMIDRAAREHLCAGEFAQDVDVEAGSVPGFHAFGCSNGSVPIRRSELSAIDGACCRKLGRPRDSLRSPRPSDFAPPCPTVIVRLSPNVARGQGRS